MKPRHHRIVKEIIQDNTGTLTPAERQLADVLLRDYPIAGLQSITKLAAVANVSTPTVIRMARKLGSRVSGRAAGRGLGPDQEADPQARWLACKSLRLTGLSRFCRSGVR
jgi:hypothetical protein